MPTPVIINPASSNETLVVFQAMIKYVGHQRTRSAPNANQLIGDGGKQFITQCFHMK